MDFSDGLAHAKTGFDLLRSAVGWAKDVQGVLPAGEKKETIGKSLDEAERQLKLAEAQIAKGSGNTLCRRQFPPAPMLRVGHRTCDLNGASVHECPVCKSDDAHLSAWVQTVGPNAGEEIPGRRPRPGPMRII